jgi:voltage-gated potassium channel
MVQGQKKFPGAPRGWILFRGGTTMDEQPHPLGDDIAGERQTLLRELQAWLEMPMLVLAFIWLGLFVVEVVWGLNRFLELTGYVIWVIFILNFAMELWLAPRKSDYLEKNWLSAIALLAPALRIFRVVKLLQLTRLARIGRVARGLRLLRVLSSVNRSMHALSATMNRRGFGYVLLLTLIVTFAGAAGMFAFENNNGEGGGLPSYGAALWWTAMIMTTMGSEYWPQSPEGRLLCFFLALYSFAMFGYVTATLATFFIGRDAADTEAELAGARSIDEMRAEIAALREEIRGSRNP